MDEEVTELLVEPIRDKTYVGLKNRRDSTSTPEDGTSWNRHLALPRYRLGLGCET